MLKKNKEHKILKKIPQKIISPKKQMIQKEKLSQELIVNCKYLNQLYCQKKQFFNFAQYLKTTKEKLKSQIQKQKLKFPWTTVSLFRKL